MLSTKLKLTLLVSFCVLGAVGCRDLKIPNGPSCVGLAPVKTGGGFCKVSVTGEEEMVSRQRIINLIWKEGAVVVPAPLYAEYIKVLEKLCSRQKTCKIKDIGRTLDTMRKLSKMGEPESDKTETTTTNNSAKAGLKTKEK